MNSENKKYTHSFNVDVQESVEELVAVEKNLCLNLRKVHVAIESLQALCEHDYAVSDMPHGSSTKYECRKCTHEYWD